MVFISLEFEYNPWEELLWYATFAFNPAIKKSTQMTPFELSYERQATTMLNACFYI